MISNMLIDTHCHLDFEDFDIDRDAVIKRAQESGVGYFINIGSSLEATERSVELADKYECIYASCGIHPHYADKVDGKILDGLSEALEPILGSWRGFLPKHRSVP